MGGVLDGKVAVLEAVVEEVQTLVGETTKACCVAHVGEAELVVLALAVCTLAALVVRMLAQMVGRLIDWKMNGMCKRNCNWIHSSKPRSPLLTTSASLGPGMAVALCR